MDCGTKKMGRVARRMETRMSGLACGLPCFFSATVGLLLCLVLGCGGNKGGGTAAQQATVIYAQAEDPKTLDPINTDIAEAVHVLTNLFDTLVTCDETTTEIVPALAERWETSADGLTWTFHLRTGVVFHDDTPCDASAVKESLDRLILKEHPLVFDPVRPYQASFQVIEKVDVTDPQTVVLTLRNPSAVLLANLAMFPASIISPTAAKKYGKDFAEHPVGTGPFQIRKWDRDQRLVLSRFDKHWRGAAASENVIFVPVKENATRVQRLRRGEIHLADGLTPIEYDSLSKEQGISVQEIPGMNVAYLTMQSTKAPLDDLRVREAIWHAIDKRQLNKVVYSDHAVPAVSMVPPPMWGYNDKLQDRSFDVTIAKQKLAEYAAEKGLTLPLKLQLSVMSQARAYMPDPKSMAGFMKDSMREVGIELEIVFRDVNQHFEALMKGEHQLGLAGWNSDNSDPDNFLYTLLDSANINDQGNNLSRYRSAEFDELMRQGQKEMDLNKRLEIYLAAQEQVFKDAPVVPLVHTKLRVALSSRLAGYQLHTTGLVRLRKAHLEGAAAK